MTSFMLKEILEAPEAVRRVLDKNRGVAAKIAEEFKRRDLSFITTVARGTSDSAATYFKYLSEIEANIPVSNYLPSVTTVYGERPVFRHAMLLAVSQSGKSTDTMLALESAKRQGALCVSMTNDAESPLAKAADYHIDLSAGEEVSVSATKSFLAQLAALSELAYALAFQNKKLSDVASRLESLFSSKGAEIEALAERTAGIENAVVLSRGLLRGISDELSLKLMETSYLLSRSFSTSDFMHGPLAVVTEGTAVLLLAPSGPMEAEFTDIARRLNLLGANVIAFTDVDAVKAAATDYVSMPEAEREIQPFLYASAIQIYAEKLSRAKGLNPDTPRNLKKVTITK